MAKKGSGRKSVYTVDQIAKDFFINGCIVKNFNAGPSLDALLACIKQVHEKPRKEGFHWEQKYPYTEDLRPNAHEYNDIFLDFLFAQNIPTLLRQVTGYDLYLGDIALRRFFPGISYMSWHRDTHYYTGQETIGRMPPIMKIIFYAALGEKPTVQLRVIPGSHRRMFRNRYLDRLQTILLRRTPIYSSDTSFFLFDSMLYHSVPSNPFQKKPAIRLFYNFCQESQLQHFPGLERLHEAYKARVAALRAPTPVTRVDAIETPVVQASVM